jgi:HD-GYP domain-containing protein (c-di-GMP phosphodiesterase class II)
VTAPIRRAEILAALSLATDLTLGQPLGHFLHTTLAATALARAAGLDADAVQQVHEVALLRMVGCTAESPTAAHVFGDEVAARAWIQGLDYGSPAAFLSAILRRQGEGLPMFERLGLIARTLSRSAAMADSPIAHCDVARMLALRLGFSEAVAAALVDAFERWDGKGMPGKKKGADIPLSSRIVYLADDLAVHFRVGGREGALAVAQARNGAAYDPELVAVVQRDPSVLAALEVPSPWDAALAAEPRAVLLDDEGLDEALLAVADYVDLKSYKTIGHSRAVADLAAAAARAQGLPEADALLAWRAGLVHDLGKVAVSTSLWDKPGPLADAEWEAVRLHPYHGERCLARSAFLAQLGAIGAADHERSDGSGYPKGLAGPALSPVARLLAVADAWQAMREERAHRPALSPQAATQELRDAAVAGRFDAGAVSAVLAAAGQVVPRKRRAQTAGLSEREIEVLRCVARGLSNKEIAAKLFISAKTVDNHLQHVYAKIGVCSRAAAAIYAADHHLLADA